VSKRKIKYGNQFKMNTYNSIQPPGFRDIDQLKALYDIGTKRNDKKEKST